MATEFQIGMQLENDTEYFGTQTEYHVYAKDSIKVCDDRYIALRANDTKEFNVFILVKNKANITIDFRGATLIMHGKIQPFLIDSSQNITIKNCKVTYARPPYTEALITEVTAQYARLQLSKHCPCQIEDGRLVPYSDTWKNNELNCGGRFYQVFDQKTRRGCGLHLGVMGNSIQLDPSRPFRPIAFTIEESGTDLLLKGDIPDYYQPGRVLVITHEARSLSSVFSIDSRNLRIENYRILSGWGMGFYSYRTENITLDGLLLTNDEASPCIVANAADAIHTFGTSGTFEIRNCVLEGMIDDAINIHANFRTVNHVCANEIYANLASCEQEANDLYRTGDEITVCRGKTIEEAARYFIQKIEPVSQSIMKFTVDRPVAVHQAGDLIENITANCNVIIDNCIFGKANSHLRLQTRGRIVMRNCETELPVDLTGDASYWFESGPVTDLTVESCRFVGDRAKIRIKSELFPTEAAPYYHQNIKIKNNEFETTTPVIGGYADGIVFRGNQNRYGTPMKLILTNCGRADIEDCTVERIFERKERLNVN